jgi:hypothetical protein
MLRAVVHICALLADLGHCVEADRTGRGKPKSLYSVKTMADPGAVPSVSTTALTVLRSAGRV